MGHLNLLCTPEVTVVLQFRRRISDATERDFKKIPSRPALEAGFCERLFIAAREICFVRWFHTQYVFNIYILKFLSFQEARF